MTDETEKWLVIPATDVICSPEQYVVKNEK